MSSPTINLNPASGTDTSFETICNLARSLVNDTQAGINGISGEGQILTDSPTISPFTLQFMNSAIRKLYRSLRNVGDPALIFDNYNIIGLTEVNGPQGLGVADPAVQVYVSQSGYYDGSTINPLLALPSNMLYLEKVWERQNATNNTFVEMTKSQFGLPSRPQQPTLVDWEWRNYNLNMVGSTQMRDIRLRYYGSLPTFYSSTLDFNSTFVPIIDCTDFLGYEIACMYARMLGSPGLPDLINETKEILFQLKNAVTRRAQSITYQRNAYGSYGNTDTNNWFLGWQ